MSMYVHRVRICLVITASLLLAKHANDPHPPQHSSLFPQQLEASCGRENFCFGNEKSSLLHRDYNIYILNY